MSGLFLVGWKVMVHTANDGGNDEDGVSGGASGVIISQDKHGGCDQNSQNSTQNKQT